MQTIYKMNVRGEIDEWSITSIGDTIYINANGRTYEEVVTPKAGRTLAQQIESRIQSRMNIKLDHGFKRTRAEALQGISNTLWMPMPMLASTGNINTDSVWVQPKLDGMRMIATLDNTGAPLAYTRGGKKIETVPHILNELKGRLEFGKYIDGELYAHGLTLQTIMSLAKRAQPDTNKLKFHAFDYMESVPFSKRTGHLRDITAGLTHTQYVSTYRVEDPQKIQALFANARIQGYEGLILRDGHACYEAGKRVRHMVKLKQFFDEEYKCIDVTTGAQGQPVLVLQTIAGGATFRATAPGDAAQKALALQNPEDFVGHWVTIKHTGITPFGIPFHPVAVAVRSPCT